MGKPNINVNVGGAANGTQTYKTVVLKPNLPFAQQLGSEDTIYVVKWDYDLGGEEVSVPANCVLDFQGGKIINGNINGSLANDVIKPEWFGAKGDGNTDDTDAFQVCASIVNQSNKIIKLELTNTKYIVTGGITFNKDVIINGNNATIYFRGIGSSFRGIHIINGTPYNSSFPSTCYMQSTTCSNVTMDKRTQIINCDNVDGSLNVGDMIMIRNNTPYSFNKTREYYCQGDLFIIRSIGEDYIGVTEESTDDYPAETIIPPGTVYDRKGNDLAGTYNTLIYKINTITAVVRDIKLEHELVLGTLSDCLKICGGINCVVDNVTASGVQNAHINFMYCYNSNINGCNVDFNSPAVNYNYGIAINNSKNITVSNNILRTKRHGLDLGGGELVIVCRNITITGNVVDNYIDAVPEEIIEEEDDYKDEVACFSTHHNAEFVTISNNVFKQGIAVVIPNSIVADNIVVSGDRCPYAILLGFESDNTVINGNEIHYYSKNHFKISGKSSETAIFFISKLFKDINFLEISDNTIVFTEGDLSSVRVVNYFTSSANKIVNFIIRGNKIAKPLSGNATFFGSNHGGYIENLIIKDNILNKYFVAVDCSNVTDTEIKKLNVKNIIISNNIVEGNNVRIVNYNVSDGKCVIEGNKIIDVSTQSIAIVSSSHISVKNNYASILGTGSSNSRSFIALTSATDVVITDNHLNALDDCYIVYITGNNDKIKAINNYCNKKVIIRQYNSPTITNSDIVAEESGNVAGRPIASTPGITYFDTSLSPARPIYWNGTTWVDATGTPYTE